MMSVPVKRGTGPAGGVFKQNHSSRSWPIYSQPAPALSPQRRREVAQHRRSRGPPRGPLGLLPNLPRRPGTGPSSTGPSYLVMAQSEVRGSDAYESNRADGGCDR